MSALACFVLLCFRNKSHKSDLLGLYLREVFFSFFQLHESPILCLFSKTTHRRTLCCTRRLKKQLIGYHTQQSVNCFIYALIKIRCCYSSTMLFTQQPVLGLMQVIYTNTVMMHNSEIISFYSMAVLALGASVCLLLVYKSYLCQTNKQ